MSEQFSEWAILELMGHRKLAGKITEATIGGAAFVRLDVPGNPGVTQFYSPQAIYCITPTTEEMVHKLIPNLQVPIVSRYELALPEQETEELPW